MHHRIETIRTAICEHYCKWRDQIGDGKIMDDICEACPMGDMVDLMGDMVDLMDRFERQHRIALKAGGVINGFVADEWYRDEFGGIPHENQVR